jgi:hypothetical protein
MQYADHSAASLCGSVTLGDLPDRDSRISYVQLKESISFLVLRMKRQVKYAWRYRELMLEPSLKSQPAR